MHRYLKSAAMVNFSIGLLKVSPFLEKIQEKSKSSFRFFSAVAALRQNSDYSSGEDKESFVTTQKICRLDSAQVCNNLHNLRINPSLAIAYFKDCESHGFCHDISTYTAIISILFNSDQKPSLVSLFSNLISFNANPGHQFSSLFFSLRQSGGGPGLVSFTLDALFKAYSTCKSAPQEAANVFFELGKLGFLPTVQSCNFLLSFVADAGQGGTLLSIFQQMREFSINPDAYSFRIMMEFFLNAKRYDFSYEILQAMVRECMQVRPLDFNKVIYGFCKESRLEEAEKLLQAMSKQGVQPDHYSYGYGYLIKAYHDTGNLLKALDLYEEMNYRGIKPTSIIVTHLLQSICKLGMNNEVIELSKKFKESGIVLDNVLYNIVINAHCRLKLMKKAMELVKEMRISGLVPDTKIYTCLIWGFCQKREIVNALKVLADMLKWGLKPDLVTYNVLLSGFCRNGLVDSVHDLLDQMPLQGIEPSVDTYCLVIKGFCEGKRVEDAEVMFKAAQVIFNAVEQNDTIHHMCLTRLFSSMVSGYLCQGYTTRAYELFERFSQQCNLIDKMVLGHLVCELCNEGNIGSACNVVDVMFREHGVVLDEFCYGKLIAAFCQRKNLTKARFWFDDMLKKGVRLNVFIYTILMNGYCKAESLGDACKLFVEMTSADMKPDVVAYTVLLDGHLKDVLKNLWLETAKENKIYEMKAKLHELTRRMKNAEIECDVICYTVLIDGHCKMEYLDHAQQLFDEMLSKGLRPDVPAYTALIHGYCSQGKIEKAQALFQEMVDSGLRPDPIAFAVLDKVDICGREMQREWLERI